MLIGLYCATDGPNWTNSSGWGAATVSTSWHGITVANNRVSGLALSQNNLTGQIPANLNTLTGLTQLWLDRNNLTGPIPDLSALTSLTQLGFNGNKLTGPIPASLNKLTSLTNLHLGKNELTGGIPDLSALTSLQILALNENHLSGPIPASLNKLTSLTEIHLQHNLQLSGPIPDLSDLDSLTQLGLQRNKLSGPIPASLSDLDSLEGLWLGNNQLSGEIPDLSALADTLTGFAFQHNKLSGPIPASLNALTRLTYLRLNHNQLTGPIPDLSALTGLTYLRLSNNKLTGGIPDLSALTGLKDLLLNDNQLSGAIPEAQLAALASLEDLGLWGNRGLTWSGNIPDRLRLRIERAALQVFYTETRYDVRGRTSWISRDGWSSGPKLSFGSWFGITTDSNGWVRRIDLSNNGLSNRLTGNFPTALEALASLERLDLSHNRDLTGTLPPGLRNLPVTALNIRCTDVRVPGSLRSWLNGIFFRSGCPSSQYGVSFSANPNPVPWDGIGSITVQVYPEFQDVSVEITNSRGLCVWDDTIGNVFRFDIPDGWSEEEAFFSVARHEGYYNGEGCENHEDREERQQCLEDHKKCFFDVSVSWTTGGERMMSSGNIILPILSPSGTRTSPGTGGGGGSGGGGGGSGGGGGGGSGGGTPPSSEDSPLPEEPQDPDQSDDCGDDDRENLVSFYDATDGDNWLENTDWKSEEPLDQWYGVDTDEEENVVSLRLSDNGLSGEIQEELLSCFSELKELALWGNEDLSGEAPEELVLAVERAALREIAELLDLNPEWFEDYGDPFNFEDWHSGVTTDDEGRVTGLDLPGEIPESIISQFKKLREIMATTSDGGCALSPEGSSAFSLFLLTLVLFAALVRRRVRR